MFFWFLDGSHPGKTPEIPWVIEDQTRVKHALLQKYISPWMKIFFSTQSNSKKAEKLIYVDSFAGPGVYYEDPGRVSTCWGSPMIVAETANQYIEEKKSRKVYIVCTEADRSSAEMLDHNLQLINKFKQKWTILNGKFIDQIDLILNNIESAGLSNYPIFFFIDPFGYSGFPMQILRRIMRYPRAELFINFMVYDVNRFVREEKFVKPMYELFGDYEFKQCPHNASPEDSYSFLLNLYCQKLKKIAGAKYQIAFRVNKPGQGTRPRFFMVHASNHIKALTTMKENMATISEVPFKFEAIGVDNPQMSLFDDPNKITLIERIRSFCEIKGTSLYDEIEEWAYINTSGIKSTIKDALMQMEKNKTILINRQRGQRSMTVNYGAIIKYNITLF